MNNARVMALKASIAVEADKAFANLALNKILGKGRANKLDRAFATELFYGTIRRLNTLDWVLGKFLKQPLRLQTVYVKNILRQGLYQIMFMDRVPVSAACNESAELARRFGHRGSVKFVNGVLRNIVRNIDKIEYPSLEKSPVDHISIKHSHPPWIVKRCIDELGIEDTIKFCKVNNTPPPNTVRTNTLRMTPPALVDRLEDDGVRAEKTRYAPEALNIEGFLSLGAMATFEEGLFYVQDEGSILAGHAVSPPEGALVLDVCGGPGGKTTHLAQLLNNTGRVVSMDIHEHKIRLIEESCRRLGIDNVKAVQGDARGLPGRYINKADCVLVDAPCSGLGVIRRNPDIRWRKVEKQLPELQKLQMDILGAASQCVKPGGILVYSTCTFTREENEEVVGTFLRENGSFHEDGLAQINVFQEFENGVLEKGKIRLWPHLHNTDGFFIARMKKRDE
ncbi:MAG TPA: 16S rRNA (cytosine(967)-C(5))-methyltransferase RsmB [Clostridia bacterium]|nr:16S rRNA (cytosine(967)-C(5))-methyltransferase RsmB [Clostridia bacterium]